MPEHKVTVYSTQSCPWCQKVKEWLNSHNIAFTEIDVSKNPEEARKMIERTGQRGVPQIDIDGTMIIGFDEDALKKALGL